MGKHLSRLRKKIREHICNDKCHWEWQDDYYCPTDKKWSFCPGPCPDGTPHEVKKHEVFVHDVTIMEL